MLNLLLFIIGIVIPIYSSLEALRSQNKNSIIIWLIYFLTFAIYRIFLSISIEPILKLLNLKFLYLKIIFIMLYITPNTGFQKSYIKFLDKYFYSYYSNLKFNLNKLVISKAKVIEEAIITDSPSPSIPEEGNIKKIIGLAQPNSENSTLVPNTPIEKTNK